MKDKNNRKKKPKDESQNESFQKTNKHRKKNGTKKSRKPEKKPEELKSTTRHQLFKRCKGKLNDVEDHDPDVEPVHWNFFEEIENGIVKKKAIDSFIHTEGNSSNSGPEISDKAEKRRNGKIKKTADKHEEAKTKASKRQSKKNREAKVTKTKQEKPETKPQDESKKVLRPKSSHHKRKVQTQDGEKRCKKQPQPNLPDDCIA